MGVSIIVLGRRRRDGGGDRARGMNGFDDVVVRRGQGGQWRAQVQGRVEDGGGGGRVQEVMCEERVEGGREVGTNGGFRHHYVVDNLCLILKKKEGSENRERESDRDEIFKRLMDRWTNGFDLNAQMQMSEWESE